VTARDPRRCGRCRWHRALAADGVSRRRPGRRWSYDDGTDGGWRASGAGASFGTKRSAIRGQHRRRIRATQFPAKSFERLEARRDSSPASFSRGKRRTTMNRRGANRDHRRQAAPADTRRRSGEVVIPHWRELGGFSTAFRDLHASGCGSTRSIWSIPRIGWREIGVGVGAAKWKVQKARNPMACSRPVARRVAARDRLAEIRREVGKCDLSRVVDERGNSRYYGSKGRGAFEGF